MTMRPLFLLAGILTAPLALACSGDSGTVPLPPELLFTTSVLPAAREGVPYVRRLESTGGAANATISYSLTSGSLPSGLSLQGDGNFSGTPVSAGDFPLTLRASDGQGGEASRQLTLSVCEAPEPMAVGEVRVQPTSAPGSCGIFLPSGTPGARYRVGVVRTSSEPLASDMVNVSLVIRGNGVSSLPALQQPVAPSAVPPRLAPLRRPMGALAAVERGRPDHLRRLEEGSAMVRRLGTRGLLPERLPARSPAAAALPERIRVDTGASLDCTPTPRVTGLRIAEDDALAIYQDSAQNAAPETRVSREQAERLLELYREFGKPVLDAYFGGVPDLDGNGRVVVFITPAVGQQALGRVYEGDFFVRDGDGGCASSNEGEYVYLHYQPVRDILDPDGGLHMLAFLVLVHEMKHVSSLWERIRGNSEAHPLWLEEGGAEIAAERAARYAWSRVGGPGMTTAVGEQHLRLESGEADLRIETFPLIWMLYGAQEHLARQPNSVVARVPGASPTYVYGSGWLFQRWLGDAYGNAGSAPFADSLLFRSINAAASPSGVPGVERATGRTWAQLMVEFTAAAMAHGSGIPVPRAFTSYDFVSAIEIWCFAVDPIDYDSSGCALGGDPPGPPGAFPWPVTTDLWGLSQSRSFADAEFAGPSGPSGLRVHDFISNGTGYGAEITVELPSAGRVVVVRLQ